MPGGAEQRAEQGAKVQSQTSSLREYWSNPAAYSSSLNSSSYRRNVFAEPVQSLWEQTAREAGAEAITVPRDEEVELLRERLQHRGVATLSDSDLLSLALRTSQGSKDIVPQVSALLANYSMQQLLNADFGELCQQHQLGEAKAAQLKAMLELARRLMLPSKEEAHIIRSPADAANLLRPEMELLDHEEMRVLLLDTKNQVVGNVLLYQGTVNSSVLRAAEVFRPAVARQCPNLIVSHNHPSGDPIPSPEDIEVTRQLVEAGKVLDIELVDHLIIGKNGRFTSLKGQLLW